MRRALFAFPLVLLLLASLAPGAWAQLPTAPPACGPLEVAVTGPGQPVAAGQAATVSVTVTNTGTADALVVVAASTPNAGWSVGPSEQEAQVASGQSASFQFTATPQEGAAAEASVNLAAEGTCSAGPLACPDGQSACRTAAPPTTAAVRYQEPPGFALPGLQALNLSLEMLVGGLLLLAFAIALPLLARRRPTFVATCPEPLKLVKPGAGASFPIEVANRGKTPITVSFDVGTVPDGWAAFMALPELQLAAGEKRSLWLMVRSPPLAAVGAKTDVTVRVRGPTGSPTQLRVRAEIDDKLGEAGPAGGVAPAS